MAFYVNKLDYALISQNHPKKIKHANSNSDDEDVEIEEAIGE